MKWMRLGRSAGIIMCQTESNQSNKQLASRHIQTKNIQKICQAGADCIADKLSVRLAIDSKTDGQWHILRLPETAAAAGLRQGLINVLGFALMLATLIWLAPRYCLANSSSGNASAISGKIVISAAPQHMRTKNGAAYRATRMMGVFVSP